MAGASAGENVSQVNQSTIAELEADGALALGSGTVNQGQAVAMSTTVSSLAQLKKMSPQIYNMLLESIAEDMIIQMQRQEKDLEQAMAKLDPSNQ